MKKILCTMFLLIMITSLIGCAKCISTETSTVQVEITDAYYRSTYTTAQYNHMNKTMSVMPHPAVYKITVKYDDREYIVSSQEAYNKYSDKIGKKTKGTLQTKTYDDGTIRYNIIDLK